MLAAQETPCVDTTLIYQEEKKIEQRSETDLCKPVVWHSQSAAA
jgi:hypothetical protein